VRVVFLTHYFPPEVGAPQVRILALARALSERGVEVAVHTAPPHYPAGRVLPPHRNRLLARERAGGLRVVRSAVLPAANRGVALRLANHLSFAASALATAPASGRADVVVAESPPLFTAAAGALYAAGKRAALVVNVADRWPASAVELGALTDARAIRAAEALERWIYRRAAVVTVPTAGLAGALGGVPEAAGKVVRIAPGVDLDRFAGPAPDAAGAAPAPLRVLYAGTIGMAQGVGTLVEAAVAAGPRVEVTIAGDGAEAAQVRELVARLQAPNVRLLGAVGAEAIPGLYRQADVAAVLLRDVPLFRSALPTKMLEAMAAGRALVLAAEGEAAQLVEATGSGVVVAPEDPAALAAALSRLAEDRALVARLGEAGRRAAADFSRARAVERWLAALERATGRDVRAAS
jgi:glycosyltransferase involved in cell wall biosynthesis